MRLFHFIKDGCLVDNQNYRFSDQKVQNYRLNDREITFDKPPRRRKYYDDEIWNFINSVSRDIEEILKDKDKRSDALVLFNNAEYEHNTDDGFISVSGPANNFTLDTGNLIGFVKRGDYALKISSRFGDRFLQYIIADADGFLELRDVGGETDADDYEWLLAYLWNIKFKRAYRLGLPKAYITRNERISKARGYIDPVDFFQNKTSGKYLCSYREHSYNSPAVSLFIKAYETVYETVKHNSFCYESRNIYNSFVAANQGFKRSRQEILNTRPFSNPFYSDYNVLIDLSKRVIQRGGLSFGEEKDTSAFLFDVSMLFEYFIRKLLIRGGIPLQSKSEKIHRIPTGSFGGYTRKLEPDIVFERDGGFYVFDVKYKTYDRRYGVKREDLFQLHTYIGQYGNDGPIKGCGFIYPMPDDQLEESNSVISDLRQQGNKIPFYVVFLPIPNYKNDNHHQFNSDMKKQCDMFVKKFQNIITNTVNNKGG